MTDCKNLKMEDNTPWHSDVFDHPSYIYICRMTGKQVVPCLNCGSTKCKDYDPLKLKI
jgi:hypothetical protein